MSLRTVWLVDAAYVFSAAPGKVDYVKLKAELERLNGGGFYESYYLNSTQDSPTEAETSFHTWLKTAPPHGPKMRVQLSPPPAFGGWASHPCISPLSIEAPPRRRGDAGGWARVKSGFIFPILS